MPHAYPPVPLYRGTLADITLFPSKFPNSFTQYLGDKTRLQCNAMQYISGKWRRRNHRHGNIQSIIGNVRRFSFLHCLLSLSPLLQSFEKDHVSLGYSSDGSYEGQTTHGRETGIIPSHQGAHAVLCILLVMHFIYISFALHLVREHTHPYPRDGSDPSILSCNFPRSQYPSITKHRENR